MNELWFGTVQNCQWVPMPADVQRRTISSIESGTLERGGGYASRSAGQHSVYDFTFSTREAHGASGLDVFQEYSTGLWNDYSTVVDGFNPNDLVYFLDPMNAEANLFPPHWAAPMLSLSGDWPWIGNFVSSAGTIANTYRQPARTVTFNVTHAAATLPAETRRRMVIPIPPGYTLRWGWSGTRTGTGVVRSEAHHKTGGASLNHTGTPQLADGATRLAHTINGDTYDYVTIGLGRTSSVASTVSITSMMAQLHPNSGATPAVTGAHIAGLGNTGCVFDGDAIPESYYLVHEAQALHLKGLSFGLKEVGAWL